MHCGQDQALLIWRAALRSRVSSNKHEKCDMHSEGVLQVKKANNVCNVKFTMKDGHYIYTQLKPLKVLCIRKEQLLMFSCHSGKFHLGTWVGMSGSKSHQLGVILFVHPTTCGTWLWQEADFNATTSSHMLFHMQAALS